MHILIPDNLHKAGLDLLNTMDAVTYYAPGKMSRDEVLAVVDQADAMIVRSGTKVDAELMDKATNLKIVVRAGVGVDNIDLEEATQRGIVVMNTPSGNTIATAEHTLGLMLALARHIPQAQASLLAGKWERKKFTGTELYRKTLGIIGFGRVGRAVAVRAKAFGMRIIAFDPYVEEKEAEDLGVEMVKLDDLWTQADYISLHATPNPDTEYIINAATLRKMKDGVRIINAARGILINDSDLAAAIQEGKVAGAAVDVYIKEPPNGNNPLIGLPGVIDTPHLGASTVEAQEALAIEAVNKVVDGLLRQQYEDVVNASVEPA